MSHGSWNSSHELPNAVGNQEAGTLHHGLPDGAVSLVSSCDLVQGMSHKTMSVPGAHKFLFSLEASRFSNPLSKLACGPSFVTVRQCLDLSGLN